MTVFRFLALVIAIGLSVIAWAYHTAIADPVVRHAEVALARYAERRPLRVLLISDVHVAGPDMPPKRLARIVRQINALKPDLVLVAGDFVSEKKVASRRYPMTEAVAPLAALRSRLGTVAVLGNHDHWHDARATRAALAGVGVRVLDNDAARVGPVAVGGLDDAFTGHADMKATIERMRRLAGAPILLSHSPDPFPDLPKHVGLMLAGHTHCGQIRLPLIGALSTMSAYGERYACGVVREAGRTLIVGAGLGTSLFPLRLGAVPDMWLITIRGSQKRDGGEMSNTAT